MSATIMQCQTNLQQANRIKRQRLALKREITGLSFSEGCWLLADAIEEMPDWLAGQDALAVLTWPTGLGPKGRRHTGHDGAEHLYLATGAKGRRLLRELTLRQRTLLADRLRGMAAERAQAA